MKTMGLIGGMSWESTLQYYRILNETVKEKLGKDHSAKCVIYSVDFAKIQKLQHEEKWDELADLMIEAAHRLERADADFLIICANTMHKLAEEIQENIKIPLLHITDAVAESIQKKGLKKVGLLGTKFTMEEDFYIRRLREKFAIDVIIPNEAERGMIHDVIYNELCQGTINDPSKEKFREIIKNLHKNGAEGVVLGCTEIPLLIKEKDADIPLFDTTTIHAKAAVEFALK
ncbi:MAG: aspartate/glutamate racemase family protein [Thermoplasmata archaeon]|nr:MAG: aspartate/glutamate racemase family protein [Thermoplasmata archaeon]